MKLRSRIMIITFLIILFVQGLNCFLEIGFLANNLEENNLNKYRLVGNQMMRKLNTSLIFGKPLSQLDFHRLLSDIVPKGVDNLLIINPAGQTLYSARDRSTSSSLRVSDTFLNEKTPEVYRIFFPLSDRNEIKGNLVIIVSHKEVKEKRFDLIRKSVFTLLVFLAVSLPILYLLLTIFINRPYQQFIQNIEAWLDSGDYEKLKENHIDLSPLSITEERLKQIRSADWLSPENTSVYSEIDQEPDGGKEFYETRLYRRLKVLMQVN